MPPSKKATDKYKQRTLPRAVILTAIPAEYEAVKLHLSEIVEKEHPKGTVYERGVFLSERQSWHILIAEIGEGNIGAAQETERAISFFEPNLIFLVGVAGGIKDVKLGDLVIATKVYGYEAGKSSARFKPRPDVCKSSYRLIQRARAEAKKKDWLQRIKQDGNNDDQESTSPAVVEANKLLKSKAINVFVRPMAAGEKVVDSIRSDVYQFIRDNYNDAFAVEMEGLGLLKAADANAPIEALVIRGISDLIKSKGQSDSDGWQSVASRHASAFAFELLAKLNLEWLSGMSKKKVSRQRRISPISKGGISLKQRLSLLKKYRQSVLNLPILPWTPERSPSLDFMWPDLIVDPLLHMHKHPSPPVRFNNWFSTYDWLSHIAIVGPPGIGKSILLRSIFIKLTDVSHMSNINHIPFLINASEILEFRQSRYKTLISYIGKKFGLKFTREIIQKTSFLLLVDGLDEVAENMADVLEILANNLSDKTTLWIACRKDFFFNYVACRPEWSSFFTDVMELLEWEEEDSLQFAENYAARTQQLVVFERLLTVRDKYPEIQPFLKNPFELILLLYLLSDDKPLKKRQLTNSYALFTSFYENWILREHHRGTARLSQEKVSELHHRIATALYKAKGLGIDLQSLLIDGAEPSLEDLSKDTSFCGLLITKKIPGTGKLKIIRFWHETIGEYLIAEEIVTSFKNGGEALDTTLKTVYHYEVNAFVRAALQCMSVEDRQRVYKNLEALYIGLFYLNQAKHEDVLNAIQRRHCSRTIKTVEINSTKEAAKIREQILYYIGRLPLTSFPEILRFAYYNEPHSLLRRIAALGAILHGNEAIEADYISKLRPSTRQDKENRSVQLVYFGDADGDIHSFCDDEQCSWERTRSAIYQRLKLTSDREISLRWWDLRTLFLFFNSRNWIDLVTSEELNLLENTVIRSGKFSSEKIRQLESEKSRLLKKLRLTLQGK